jgi:transposase
MENLLLLLEPLFGFEVNYKYVERLYSDEEVKLALHNLFVLLLEEESSGKISGDGTGYSLSIAKHYRTSPKKEGKSYVCVFRAIDIETGMYAAFGHSSRSESEAFRKALRMLKGVEIDSIAMDRYYSSRSVLRIFGAKTSVYVTPKKNTCNFGVEWMRVLKNIIKAPAEFLKSYFKRNLSESGFSSDKRRFGWRIRQRRSDRREQALFCTTFLHNKIFVRRAMS